MSISKEEREALVDAIHAGSWPSGEMSRADAAMRFFDSTWAALCHSTGRCGRFYQPDDPSPEARIYHLMKKAFQE